MFTAPVHRQSLRAPAPGVTLHGAGVALLLLGCLCEAVAQDLPLRASHWADMSLSGHSDERATSTSFEVTAVRSHLAPAAALPDLDGRATRPLAGVSYRAWMLRGRTGVGIGLGSLGYVVPSTDDLVHARETVVGAVPTVTLGLRYHVSDEYRLFADASGARGLGSDRAAAHVGSKVGVEWQPAKSTLGFERGAIGLQLDSGYRLSLKARRGGALLYLRGRF
jgi:hypothetical protein